MAKTSFEEGHQRLDHLSGGTPALSRTNRNLLPSLHRYSEPSVANLPGPRCVEDVTQRRSGALVAEDDREAFTRWASQLQLALLRLAVLVSGDHHRAEDLVQEALTQVALRWRTLRDGHPEAYARQVIVRGNVSWWRRHRREVVTDTPDTG